MIFSKDFVATILTYSGIGLSELFVILCITETSKNPATDENDAFLPWLKDLARCSLFLRNPQPADRSAGYLRLCIHSHPIGGRAPGPVR